MLWPSTADAKSYSLPAADVAVQIQPDGSLLVQERITFDFSGDFSGAYRDIPLRAGESIDKVGVSEGGDEYIPGANTELGSFGVPGSFGVEQSSKLVRIVWHYRALDERRTFTIKYRFRGLAVAYDDVVDVNLRVWGDEWKASLGSLNARMQLPRAAPLGPSYRVWGSPAWVRGVVDRAPERSDPAGGERPGRAVRRVPRHLSARACSRRPAGAQVRSGNGLPKILADELASQQAYEHDRERIDDAKEPSLANAAHPAPARHRGRRSCSSAASGGSTGASGATGYDREYEQAPPTDTEPALVPSLVRQETAPGSNEFTATLFDLIRRGRYTSTPVTTERKVWGGLRHEDVADLQLAARRRERAAHRVRGARRRGRSTRCSPARATG